MYTVVEVELCEATCPSEREQCGDLATYAPFIVSGHLPAERGPQLAAQLHSSSA